jgi:hypothetical protein
MTNFYHLFTWRLDLVALVVCVALVAWLCTARVARQRAGLRLPRWLWLAIAALLVAAGLTAEWVQRERTDELVTVFAGFGPTYAKELQIQGHATVTLDTPPDDPIYLQLIAAERGWLEANPLIADVYTFRQDSAGKLRLIVDSETDYDRNGRIEGEREKRTAIGEVYPEATEKFYRALKGSREFESDITSDRWGVWVSSFTPIYDDKGRVEAAVGIDYPASTWISAIAAVRGLTLLAAFILITIVLSTATSVTLLNAEIEERRAAQARLEAARESALTASAAKSEFLAVTSHEVRTPLTAIMGFAEMLAETPLDEQQRRYVDTINTAGQRLVTLINDILDFTKIENGKIELIALPWSPALVIHEVMDLMAPRADAKGLTLHFDHKLANDLQLVGDANRVRQVLLNLLMNAVKFTALGSVTVHAAWTPAANEAHRGRLLLRVSDTGPGIPAEKIPLLFQVFSQVDTSAAAQQSGSGLGLAICKRLTELMGGEISVTSTPGAGTTFSVTLDCPSVVPETPAEAGLHAAESPDTAPIAVNAHALVIDDNRLNRELLKLILSGQGLAVDLAPSGVEGLGLALLSDYDVIFMDIDMPGVDGYKTTEQIRAIEPAGRHVPIIAVTGLTAKGTRELCHRAGMDDYLTKPVYLPALRSALTGILPPEKLVAKAGTRHGAAVLA